MSVKVLWRAAGILAVLSVAACQKKEEKPAVEEKAAVPEKVVVHVASDFDYAPFVYKDPPETDPANPNHNKKGLEVDILTELSKRLDFTVVFEELKFEEIIEAVASGRVDAAIGGITVTPGRKEKVLFTSPIYKSQLVTIVTVDNTATTWDDDQEYDLLVVSDPDFPDFVSKMLSEKYKKLKVSNFPLWQDVLSSFETNKGGLFVTDRAHAEHLVKNSPNLRIANEFVDQTGLTTGGGLPISFAFSPKHKDLVIQINVELAKMEEDGSLKHILQQVQVPEQLQAESKQSEQSEKKELKQEEESELERALEQMAAEGIEPVGEVMGTG